VKAVVMVEALTVEMPILILMMRWLRVYHEVQPVRNRSDLRRQASIATRHRKGRHVTPAGHSMLPREPLKWQWMFVPPLRVVGIGHDPRYHALRVVPKRLELAALELAEAPSQEHESVHVLCLPRVLDTVPATDWTPDAHYVSPPTWTDCEHKPLVGLVQAKGRTRARNYGEGTGVRHSH
jgi:hypothetical protein